MYGIVNKVYLKEFNDGFNDEGECYFFVGMWELSI